MRSSEPVLSDEPIPDAVRQALALLRCLENIPAPEDVFPFPAPGTSATPAREESSGAWWIEDFDRILKAPLSSVQLATASPEIATRVLSQEQSLTIQQPLEDTAVMDTLLHELLEEETACEVDLPELPDLERLELPETAAFAEASSSSALVLTQTDMGATETEIAFDVPEISPVVPETGKPHLDVRLAGLDYALALGHLREISQPLRITPVPRMPAWLRGVSNVRGDIVAVVDLRVFFALPPQTSSQTRLLIVTSARGDVTTGLLVDGARAICRFNEDRVAPVTLPIEPAVQPYVLGQVEHGGRLLHLLDLERLLQALAIRPWQRT